MKSIDKCGPIVLFTRALTESLKYDRDMGLCGAKWIKMGQSGSLSNYTYI